MATNAYVPHLDGYVDNAGPKIVTSRFTDPDAYKISNYKRSGGYQALEAALDLSPDAVAEQIKDAVLLGRGGAGFPAGVKWGFLPDVFPRYLVVNLSLIHI